MDYIIETFIFCSNSHKCSELNLKTKNSSAFTGCLLNFHILLYILTPLDATLKKIEAPIIMRSGVVARLALAMGRVWSEESSFILIHNFI